MSNLRFQPDGRFTIVQLTDLHWRDGDDSDQRTRLVINSVLEAERPDLVVVTGDVIDGDTCTDPARSWRQAVAAMDQRGIPWAAVFGNHDDEGAMSRHELMAVQQSCSHCVSQPGPSELPGVGNYVLDVASSRGAGLATTLYFFDSGGLSPHGDGEYAWIMPQQIAWYAEISARRQRDNQGQSPSGPVGARPALAFFHIPIPEFDEVWRTSRCRGVRQEGVCCPRFNSGLFSAFRRCADVVGVFVGHDHLNDFEGTLHEIHLCYGRATGHNGYGRDDFPRGARVIELIEGQRTFRTWLWLEDGTVA
jgi:3',5'-cyclic AMP phosphodiesterase CpdA